MIVTIEILITLFLIMALLVVAHSLHTESKKQRKARQLETAFNTLVSIHDLQVGEADFFNNRVISIDEQSKKLVLVDQSKVPARESCVPLNQLVKCRLIKRKDAMHNTTSKIVLELVLKDEGNTSFAFFAENRDKIYEKPAMLRKAAYWKNKIELHALNKNRHLRQSTVV